MNFLRFIWKSAVYKNFIRLMEIRPEKYVDSIGWPVPYPCPLTGFLIHEQIKKEFAVQHWRYPHSPQSCKVKLRRAFHSGSCLNYYCCWAASCHATFLSLRSKKEKNIVVSLFAWVVVSASCVFQFSTSLSIQIHLTAFISPVQLVSRARVYYYSIQSNRIFTWSPLPLVSFLLASSQYEIHWIAFCPGCPHIWGLTHCRHPLAPYWVWIRPLWDEGQGKQVPG